MFSFFCSASSAQLEDKPLKKNSSLLNYYIEKSFNFIDVNQTSSPRKLLIKLLDAYLNINQLSKLYYNHTIEQQNLAQTMKLALECMTPEDSVAHVFRLLNESHNDIKPNDDLIWLFSAFCSLFPEFYSQITNRHIKDALFIRRDVHDNYLYPVMNRFIKDYAKREHLKILTKQVMEIAYLTHYYEGFLKEILIKAKERNILNLRIHMHAEDDDPLIFATQEQIEIIVLPWVLSFFKLGNDTNSIAEKENQLMTILRCIDLVLNKVSLDILEKKVIPELLDMYKHPRISSYVNDALLICIERIDADALNRGIFPVILSSLNEEDPIAFLNNFYNKNRYKLLLTLFSKLSKEENDKLSEQLIIKFKKSGYPIPCFILSYLKELRGKQYYVNDHLFQTANGDLLKKNDEFLQNLNKPKDRNYNHLFVEHMTAPQVQELFAKISLENEYKKYGHSFLEMLAEFPALSSDVYTKALSMQTFKFCMDHFFEANRYPKLMKVLIRHLKQYDFNDADSRKMLVDLAYHAIDKIKALSHADVVYGKYHKLLEVSVSLMTEKELIDTILPKIDFKKMSDHSYSSSMGKILCSIFNKINDQEVLTQYFVELTKVFIPHCAINCSDALRIIIEKFDQPTRVLLGRLNAKNGLGELYPFGVAYLSALCLQANREMYKNIPEAPIMPIPMESKRPS